MSPAAFDFSFQALKARILSIGGASGLAWGLFVAGLVLLVGVWVDLVWELSAGARVAAVLVAIAAAAVLLSFVVSQAFRRMRDDALIRHLDHTGRTGGQIVSGYELRQMPVGGGGAVALSQGLAQLAALRAGQLVEQISPAEAAPIRPMRNAVVAAAALVGCLLIAAFVAPRLSATEWMRFADPFGDHPPYSRSLLTVEPGDTKVRYGDSLDVVVKVEGPPVEDLQLVLLRAEREAGGPLHEELLPMFAEGDGRWRTALTAVTLPATYFAKAPAGTRSHRFQLDVITVPQITDVRFRITPPAYTRDAIYEGPLPKNGISALPGTRVEMTVASNRPLKSGVVTLPGGKTAKTVPLIPVGGEGSVQEVRGQWTIEEAGTFVVHVTDEAGEASREPFSGTISLLKDQSPLVRVSQPPPQSLATPSAILPVMVSGEDDYGITKLQLYRSLNDTRATPMSFPTGDPVSRRHEDPAQLPLSQYGLQPGDVIKLFARAEDNDPAGAKGAESPIAVIQIISEEELNRLVQAREGAETLLSKYQAAERRMEAVQEELEALEKKIEERLQKEPGEELTAREKEELETLKKKIEEEADALRKSMEQKLGFDLDKALEEELETLAKQLDQAAEETEKLSKQEKPNAAETLRKLQEMKKALAQKREEFEKGVTDPLEQLSEIYPVMEDQERFVELYHRQRDLAERLASLKEQEDRDDPSTRARMRELEAEQRKIREDLGDLLQEIESHVTRLPTDNPDVAELAKSATEFVEAVRASGATEAMSGAESALAEFSGQGAKKEAKSAADILESFLSKCQSNGQQGNQACKGLKFSPGEGSLGDTLEQLMAGAGLKPGSKPGHGQGTGSGFSARRNSLSNMGLFGSMPTQGNPKQSKSGQGKQAASVGGSYRTDESQTASSRLDPHGLLKSSGASEAAIPARYRAQVERYFQQIAEEAAGGAAASAPSRENGRTDRSPK